MKDDRRGTGWLATPAGRLVASRQARLNIEAFRLRPKCGATRRNGELCKNPGLENGRCRLHGGRTPKGADWHRIQSTGEGEKDARKLADHARKERRRLRRLAKMTPEERQAYDNWHRDHVPGGAAGRARERKRRADAKFVADLLREDAAPAPSPEREAIAETMRQLQAAKAEIDAELALGAGAETELDSEDIFG